MVPPDSTEFTRIDRGYRTKASGISHNGIIYADSDENVAKAMSRLLKCRGTFEDEMAYQAAQKRFIGNHADLLDKIRGIYSPYFVGWQGAEEECRQHYDDPHPKRDLRIQAYNELVHGNSQSYRDPNLFSRLWLRKVIYKMKKNEFAKPGKPPRMIGDLGVAASLQGFRLTEVLKQAMAKEDLQIGNMRAHFCKAPTTEELIAVFKNLLDPPIGCKYYFAYFSDDSCLSVRQADGTVRTFNLDISGCDASHTGAIFQALVDITPEIAQDDMQVLVDQCKLPIIIYFKGGDTVIDEDGEARRPSLSLQPIDPMTNKKSPRLYSGSTITTAINNLACILGATSVQESGAETPHEISDAFALAGYKMTVEECTDYSDIQFLKNSPAYDIYGELWPLLNLGVLLRSAGTCTGDLPGTKDLTFKQRHDDYMGSLISGMYTGVSFPLIDAMRTWATAGNKQSNLAASNLLAYKHQFNGTATFTSSEVYRRYRLSDLEIQQLDEEFGNAGYAHYYNSSGASTILTRDYGLACVDSWEVPYEDRGYQ